MSKKCVCGYEREDDKWKNSQRIPVDPTKERFIEITGTFLVESTGWGGGKHEVSLYACPKCKTVQMID